MSPKTQLDEANSRVKYTTCCSSCNVGFPFEVLLPNKCESKHKMCRYCIIANKNTKCELCKKTEDQALDKYFSYKELSGQDRVAYN